MTASSRCIRSSKRCCPAAPYCKMQFGTNKGNRGVLLYNYYTHPCAWRSVFSTALLRRARFAKTRGEPPRSGVPPLTPALSPWEREQVAAAATASPLPPHPLADAVTLSGKLAEASLLGEGQGEGRDAQSEPDRLSRSREELFGRLLSFERGKILGGDCFLFEK